MQHCTPQPQPCPTVRTPKSPSSQIRAPPANPSGKRNTSRPVFTSHERNLAKRAWGETSARLSRDSFLPLGSCALCLEPAVDPVACPQGDVFCRECALSNILAQKKELKRAARDREAEARAADEARREREREEHQRAVRDFEMVQHGFRSQLGGRAPDKRSADDTADDASGAVAEDGERGVKRKFAADGEKDAEKIAQDERAKARKVIEDEKVCWPSPLPPSNHQPFSPLRSRRSCITSRRLT